MKRAGYLYGLPPFNLSLIIRKISDKSQLRDILLKSVKANRKKKSEKMPHSRKAQEDMTTKCDMVS